MEARSGSASGKAIASLVLGILSIVVSMLIALVGLIAGLVGLGLGVLDRREGGRGIATAGIVCSAAGTAVALFNYAVTFYLVTSGRYHPLGH